MKLIMEDKEIRQAIASKVAADFNTQASLVEVGHISRRKGGKVDAEVELNARVVTPPKAVE